MRKVMLVLAMLVGLLIPLGVFNAPAANAVTCGVPLTNTGAWGAKWERPYGADMDFRFQGQVDFRFCSDSNGTFAKVSEYRVVGDVSRSGGCGNVELFRVNPNVLNWWNPVAKEKSCGGTWQKVWSWTPDSTCDCVNVYPSLPENERCIGSVVTLENVRAFDENKNVPTICVI